MCSLHSALERGAALLPSARTAVLRVATRLELLCVVAGLALPLKNKARSHTWGYGWAPSLPNGRLQTRGPVLKLLRYALCNVTRCYIITHAQIAIARSSNTATLKRMFEQQAKAIAAVAAGRSLRSVARECDVTPVTIMRWYREARPDDPATRDAALACLAEGWAPLDVARAAGVPPETIRRWARDATRVPSRTER